MYKKGKKKISNGTHRTGITKTFKFLQIKNKCKSNRQILTHCEN